MRLPGERALPFPAAKKGDLAFSPFFTPHTGAQEEGRLGFVIFHTINPVEGRSLLVMTVDNFFFREYNCQQSYSNSIK